VHKPMGTGAKNATKPEHKKFQILQLFWICGHERAVLFSRGEESSKSNTLGVEMI